MISWPNKLLRLTVSAVLVLSVCCHLQGQDAKDLKLRTVVIDAGHGGHDPGALSPDRKLRESDINLEIATSLGRMIKSEFGDVKVIYTRTNDVFVPLAERANIANRNHADLFISVHVNAARRGSSASGTETFVMGTDKSESNMEVCRKENDVILLEDNYNATYQGFDPENAESYIFFNLMQNAHFEQSIAMASMVQQNMKKGPISKSRGVKQAPLMVLWRTTMPSILIEVGFISNTADRKVLSDKGQRQEIARSVFNAFKEFKGQYDAHTGFTFEDQPGDEEDLPEGSLRPVDSVVAEPAVPAVPAEPEAKSVAPAAPAAPVAAKSETVKSEDARFYRIQIFATSRKFKKGAPELKGLTDYECTNVNGLFKYTVGRYQTKDEAQRNLGRIRKKFNGAFVTYF